MAMNWHIFRVRALSALFFVAVMLGGLLWNQWSFLFLFLVVHAGCWWEYQKLMGIIYPRYTSLHFGHRYGIILAGCGLLYRFQVLNKKCRNFFL